MAEETTIRRLRLGWYSSTVDEMMRQLRNLTPTEKIHLILSFRNHDGFRFSETVELRELILEKKSNIHRLVVVDGFDFLIQFLLANNGETKHFDFTNCFDTRERLQLEQATELSNAIRSNNNGTIKSFMFTVRCDSQDVFQRVWDAVLTTGVQDIELNLVIPKNNNNDKSGGDNIDFSNISTNTSLKELTVLDINLCGTNLFHSIKGNTTVEKLIVSTQDVDAYHDNKGKKTFLEMLLENTTFLHVELKDGHFNRILREEISIHTTLNQIWKRLIIVKQKERMATATAATAAAISTTTTNVTATTATDDDDDATVERRREQGNNDDEVEKDKKIAEEKKMMRKKKEMNLWLKTFEKKPVICNELIYLFLTENADMYSNNGILTVLERVERKKKRQKECYMI